MSRSNSTYLDDMEREPNVITHTAIRAEKLVARAISTSIQGTIFGADRARCLHAAEAFQPQHLC